jgi:uncharacterized membrane protein YuzA (DUF378 family)
MKNNTLDMLVTLLVIVGGLNWGLVGAFNFNLVDTLLGAGSMLAKVVYIAVGLAAVYMAYMMSMKMSKSK